MPSLYTCQCLSEESKGTFYPVEVTFLHFLHLGGFCSVCEAGRQDLKFSEKQAEQTLAELDSANQRRVRETLSFNRKLLYSLFLIESLVIGQLERPLVDDSCVFVLSLR